MDANIRRAFECAAFTMLGALSLVVAPAGAAVVPVGTLAASLPGQGNYGTIKGKLVWGGAEAVPEKVLEPLGKAEKDPTVCAKDAPILDRSLVVDPRTKGVRFGFAYLVSPQGSNPDAAKALLAKEPVVEIDQKNCEFRPHSTAMMVGPQGQKLVLKSSDPTGHNIRIGAFNNNLNQMLAPNGEMTWNPVSERRPISVNCDIHPWMKANLMVFDHPYFAVTGEDGSFEITGVPAGAQQLVIWQERVGYVSTGGTKGMAVEVKPGGVTDVGAIVLDPSKVK
jgi:hypothetical protein